MRGNHSVRKQVPATTVAQALLCMLADRGVKYAFGVAGSDFAPLVDALAWAKAGGQPSFTPITVPHEMVAISMAHGYYLTTGRPQAAIIHTTVGTANAMTGIINAARGNIPIIILAGRSPTTEHTFFGSRDTYSQWAQESFDQASMLREYVKWDYELRAPVQLETVLDRAFTVAMTPPRGPVYLTLPRELFASSVQAPFVFSSPMRQAPAMDNRPDAGCIEDAAALLAASKAPVIITSEAGRSHDAVRSLIELAELGGFPVVVNRSHYMNFPSEHPLHAGYDPRPFFADQASPYRKLGGADTLLVIESDAPWYLAGSAPRPAAHVIQMAQDPFYCRYPVRGFPCDVPIAGEPAVSIRLLIEALRGRVNPALVAARTQAIKTMHDALRARWDAMANACAVRSEISPTWVARCVNDVKDDDTIIVSESTATYTQMRFNQPGTLFENSPAGGLGWVLGAALGVKLGAMDRTVISLLGDGNYMLSLPTSAHFVGAASGIPTLTVILNNQSWHSVRQAHARMYPGGWAEKTGDYAFTHLTPSPRFEQIAEACGAYGRAVTAPDQLPEELRKALAVVRNERRQAVLNVLCTTVD